jgi:hypothetical protein
VCSDHGQSDGFARPVPACGARIGAPGKYRRTRLFVVTLGPIAASRSARGDVERGGGHAKNTPVKDLASEAGKKLRPHLDHREADCRHAHNGIAKGRVAATSAEKNPGLQQPPVGPSAINTANVW